MLLSCLASAMFISGEAVPVQRLMANVKAHFATYENRAEAHYLLGRLESLAFSGEADSVSVFGNQDNQQLPRVTFWSWVQENSDASASRPVFSPQTRELFFSGSDHYRRAIELNSNNALYHFSMGWMEDQSQRFISQVGSPPATLTGDGKHTTWRMLAIHEYQEATRLSPVPTRGLDPGPVLAEQSREALIFLLREEVLERIGMGKQSDMPFIADAQRQIADIQNALDRIEKLPRSVTPLIFSTHPNARLADLLSPSLVSFDLGGFGENRRWPWLQPDTAILVWDPKSEGHIRSGRQLFGSVTWWMFWQDGFEPLAALDDNGDGWLKGRELDGIGVWQDRNGNGVSDPGEVIPAAQFGILAIGVHAQREPDGVLAERDVL